MVLCDICNILLNQFYKYYNQKQKNLVSIFWDVTAYHDKKISRKVFEKGQKILLYHSRFKLIPSKLRFHSVGLFVVTNAFEHVA